MTLSMGTHLRPAMHVYADMSAPSMLITCIIVLENLGAVYSGSSNWEGAVDAFKKAVALAPAKLTYRASLAKMLFRTGTY